MIQPTNGINPSSSIQPDLSVSCIRLTATDRPDRPTTIITRPISRVRADDPIAMEKISRTTSTMIMASAYHQ